MKITLNRNFYLKIIFTLLLINYQIVTIFFNDVFLLKYLRDIVLVGLIIYVLKKKGIHRIKSVSGMFCIIFLFFGGIAVIKTNSVSTSFLFGRRYIFPVVLLYLILAFNEYSEEEYYDLLRYILNTLFILSLWGLFQAIVLGDEFLIKVGYPTKYSYGYGMVKLKDSFYFGNLGIQRFVSTLSNTNVCALIWGVCIIVLLSQKKMFSSKANIVKIGTICLAYIYTFSRANILAMSIILVVFFKEIIPIKVKKWLKYIFILIVLIIIIAFISRNDFIMRIYSWIVASLSGKEASASGRALIWYEAWKMFIHNPLGYGFGYVGSYAQSMNVDGFVHAENSYLAMAIDTGIGGIVCYVGFLLGFVKKFKYCKSESGNVGKAIVLYMMICFFFSNHIYDMEAVSIVFMLAGLLLIKRKIN